MSFNFRNVNRIIKIVLNALKSKKYIYSVKNVMYALKQAMTAQKRKYRWAIVPFFLLNSALDGGGRLTPRPGSLTPWKETQYPLYSRLGGSQVKSGRVGKISLPPGIFFCFLFPP